MLFGKKRIVFAVAAAIVFLVPAVSYAYTGESPASADIVYIVDTSGSVEQTDGSRYTLDALALGVDLAPENSRVAILATEPGQEAGLTDVSASGGRESLKGFIRELENKGDTDFTLGFERALSILQASDAGQKRVIFFGDFSEGGYNMGSGDAETEAAARIDRLAADAKTNGVAIDMIVWGEAPETGVIAPKLQSLPEAAGGELITVTDLSRLPACIEDIYFRNYEYQTLAVSVRGQTEQTFDISMPTANVRRARVYVSAQNPASDFGASYSGAVLDGEQNRSYSMVDLTDPSREGVKLTLTPGTPGSATIYTLLEYNPMKLAVSAENELSDGIGADQTTAIHAEIVDETTGTPLLTVPYADDAVYSVRITAPPGEASPVQYSAETPTIYNFSPEQFGAYQVTAELTVDGITFGPFTASVDVPDVRPVPVPEEPPNWPLIIAAIIGSALVLAGLVIALRIRQKEVEYQGAVEMASDYRFHGKLSIYAVILDGGEREIRPFDFSLHTIGEKRITLRSMLDSVGARDTYPGAEDILFLVGPEESVVMRNNSHAIVRVMGRSYEYRSKAQVFYDQKIYIVFDQNENELEIVYRKVRNEDSVPVNFTIQSRRTRAQSSV